MKRIRFQLAAIILVVFNGMAQEVKGMDNSPSGFKCGAITTHFENEIIEYNFRSLEDLAEGINEIIQEFNFKRDRNKDCLIKIEIRIELNQGGAGLEILESVTTSCCDEALVATGEKLRKILAVAAKT